MKTIELYNDDCLEVMDELIKNNIKVDAIITDPPYGTTACSWDSIIDFKEMWKRLNKLIKSNGAIVLFGSEPFSSHLRISNIKNYKYDWVWIKNTLTGTMLAKKQPMRNKEDICVFYENQCLYNRQMIKRSPKEFKAYYRKNDTVDSKSQHFNGKQIRQSEARQWWKPPMQTLYFKRDTKRNGKSHPTQKPVALMEYLIKTYTNENEIVLDFTMGSGTTGIACLNTNRKFIGIEKDDKYFKLAKNRIENHKIQQSLF